VLDLDAVKAGITLNEDDLRTYYKENLSRLAGKEERRASHILIGAAKDARLPSEKRPRPRPWSCWPSCARRLAALPNLRRRTRKIPDRLRLAAIWVFWPWRHGQAV
jgi:peptidyl-prolyl cis-trans isomerase D